MNIEKYGEAHRQAKKAKLERVGYKCQITEEQKRLESHHVQPKSLDIGTENNLEFESNHMILASHFHKALHEAANVGPENTQLLFQRKQYAKRVWKDPEDGESMEKLRRSDEVLYEAFIKNMLDNLSHSFREKVIHATLISFMETNRDIKIEIRKRDVEIEALQKEVEMLKRRQENNIIDITQYNERKRE